ncbi:hypothetical protein GCM10017673_44020 [Streptosporangium violaceochromogenes]|nr:hypothetical protein GCM10017673_44020 [Streptosporangium violaceochromogenes]
MRLPTVLTVLLMVTACSAAPADRASRVPATARSNLTPGKPTPAVETSPLPGGTRSGRWRQTSVNHGRHSTTISDLTVLADGTAYAIGEFGTYGEPGELLLQRGEGGIWRQEAAPRVRVEYDSLISGTSADDLWIVHHGESGPVRAFHRAGGAWSATVLGNTIGDFYPLDLDVVAPGKAWSVGCSTRADSLSECPSTVVEFHGGTWRRHSVPITARSLTGHGPSHVWAVGYDPSTKQPAAASFDGATWTRARLPRLPRPTGRRVRDWRASLVDVLSTGDGLLAVGYTTWLDVGPDGREDGEEDEGDDQYVFRSLVMRLSAGRWSHHLSPHGPMGDELELAPAGQGDAWVANGTPSLWRLSGTRWVRHLNLQDTSIEAIASWPGTSTAWAATVTETFRDGSPHRHSAYWRID